MSDFSINSRHATWRFSFPRLASHLQLRCSILLYQYWVRRRLPTTRGLHKGYSARLPLALIRWPYDS
jgi:hypothetical protein